MYKTNSRSNLRKLKKGDYLHYPKTKFFLITKTTPKILIWKNSFKIIQNSCLWISFKTKNSKKVWVVSQFLKKKQTK